DGGYIQLSGTSMSAAVVSGAVALLLEAQPALTPAEVKTALQTTTTLMPGAGLMGAGTGSLDVERALRVAYFGLDALVAPVSIEDEPAPASGLALLPGHRAGRRLVW